jgi:hypothetical protein
MGDDTEKTQKASPEAQLGKLRKLMESQKGQMNVGAILTGCTGGCSRSTRMRSRCWGRKGQNQSRRPHSDRAADYSRRGTKEALVAQVARLRTDPQVYDDVMGVRDNKIPITAVVADLSNPKDAGLKKAVARVKRAMK